MTGGAGLTREVAQRLLGFLDRLASPSDAERAAAGLLATKVLRDQGLTWPDVLGLARSATAGKRAPERPDDWQADLDTCRRCLLQLSHDENSFIIAVAGQRSLSPGETAKLARIAASLRARGRP